MRTTMKMLTVLRAAAGGGVAAPEAPTGLTATVFSTSRIDLTWTDNADNEDGYKVYRSTDNVSFSEIDDIAADSEAYSDTTITAGTTYYYKVAAYNAGGEAESNVDAANTLTLNLVSWWQLDESSPGSSAVQRNDSHGTNHLSDINTVPSASASFGTVVSVARVNNEELTSSAAVFNVSGSAFEVAVWVRLSATHAGGTGWLLGRIGAVTWDWGLEYNTTTSLRLQLKDLTPANIELGASNLLSADTWYCVNIWYTGSSAGIRLNDSIQVTASVSGTLPNAQTNFYLPSAGRAFRVGFDGMMAAATFTKGRIWTAAERTAFYNGGTPLTYAAINP